jgi:hypothetical protein
VTAGAFQTTFMGAGWSFLPSPYGNQDGFVAKLSSDGSRLLWASYFGTTDDRIIRDLDVDGNGDIYIASARNTGSYPASVAGAFINSPIGGITDAVFAKIKGDGSRVLWAKYLGGTGGESGTNSVRVDAQGNPALPLRYRIDRACHAGGLQDDPRRYPGPLRREVGHGDRSDDLGHLCRGQRR